MTRRTIEFSAEVVLRLAGFSVYNENSFKMVLLHS